MSELDLEGFTKHLPDNHKVRLEISALRNTAARYLEVQQLVWKLREDIQQIKEIKND